MKKKQKTKKQMTTSFTVRRGYDLYRESYMSAHDLFNLLNELWKSEELRGSQSSILSLFRNVFNNLKITCWHENINICHLLRDVIMCVILQTYLFGKILVVCRLCCTTLYYYQT